MKNLVWLGARAALVCLAIFGASVCRAQIVKEVYLGTEVTVQLDRVKLLVGEPLYVKITAKSLSAALRVGTLQASFFLSDDADIAVTVRPPGELPYRYTANEESARHPTAELNLDIGESSSYIVPVLYDKKSPNGYVFSKPGDYYVGVKFTFGLIREIQRFAVELPPIRITVTEPEGRNAEAFKLINNPKAALALHVVDPADPAVVAAAKKVANDYPDTVYAPLCMYLVGAEGFLTTRQSYKESAAIFLKFLKLFPDHPRAGDAIFNVAAAYDSLKQEDLARAWIFFLRDRHPDHYLMRKETPMALKYYFGPVEQAAGKRWWLYPDMWRYRPPVKDH
ncbi:MAG: hypothetical protein K1X53_06230 [Candidatus Sumerlaeaceae bacterium]|nr:hypothetical protein [Candidatus Sumerlaeaceae bacterium]